MIRPLLRKLRYARKPCLYWSRTDIPNWGDDINPWLYKHLTGNTPTYCPHPSLPRLLMAGSILKHAGAEDTIWGTGLIEDPGNEPLNLKCATALRGPLTAAILEARDLPTTTVFGDPGLLAASLVNPDLTKTYKSAVVPHYADADTGSRFAQEIGATIVPVSLDSENFVRTLAGAEAVFSSSLHGIICAESMGIPAYWIKLSDNIIGGHFKFLDYLGGTDRDYQAMLPSKKTALPAFDVDSVTQRLRATFPGIITK